MIEFEKKRVDGMVAVLVSSGYGAGWSTWNSGEIAEAMKFDKRLVEMVENGKASELTEEYLQNLWDTDEYICDLGNDQLDVAYLPEGTNFYIDEYDGSESIISHNNLTSTA